MLALCRDDSILIQLWLFVESDNGGLHTFLSYIKADPSASLPHFAPLSLFADIAYSCSLAMGLCAKIQLWRARSRAFRSLFYFNTQRDMEEIAADQLRYGPSWPLAHINRRFLDLPCSYWKQLVERNSDHLAEHFLGFPNRRTERVHRGTATGTLTILGQSVRTIHCRI